MDMPAYKESLNKLIELTEKLYGVTVRLVNPSFRDNLLHLYTDSKYPGLGEITFPITEKTEKSDILNYVNELEKSPFKAMKDAKTCRLNY